MSPRPRRSRGGCIFAAIALALLVGIGAGAALLVGRSSLEPVDSAGTSVPVSISVSAGENVDNLSVDLAAHHLIRSEFWFGLYARFRSLSSHLHAGTFNLSASMGASEIINVLEGTPAVGTHKLVVTEGMRATDIAGLVAGLGIGVSADDYMREVNSGRFTETFIGGRAAGQSLEGFLFPDTYQIPERSTAHDIVEMQLQDFARKAEPALTGTPQQQDALLITASIIEREAKFPADFPLVSSVINNRLAAGMNLEIDATVLYGLNLKGGSLTAAQLATDTPYNTYVHSGLPPTPISNPGVAAINAALHPASTQYLYYVSDDCGHNHYSVDLATHNQQVAQYIGTPC